MMTENNRRRAALAYLQWHHPMIALRIAAQGELNGLGDFWSELRDKAIGNVKTSVKAKVDSATAGLGNKIATGDAQGQAGAVSALSQLLGPASATALYNLYRIERGKAPVQVTDVVGASKESQALRLIPIAIASLLGAWGLSALIRSMRGR